MVFALWGYSLDFCRYSRYFMCSVVVVCVLLALLYILEVGGYESEENWKGD